MKILILTDNIAPFSGGGMEVAVSRLIDGYIKNGHQCIIAATVQKQELAESQNYRFYADYHDRWRGLFSLWNFKLTSELKKILIKEKPDIVHIHNIHKHFSYYSLKIIKQMGIPSVLTIHDCMPVCYKKFTCFINRGGNNFFNCLACQKFRFFLFPFRNFFIRYYINKYPDKVVAVSQELQKLLKINNIRCDDFIHHGIDLEKFKTDEKQIKDFKNKYKLNGKKIIFFGGRTSEAKGINYLIKAIDILYKKRQDILLLITGAEPRGVQRLYKIFTTGWLGPEELNAAYACSDVIVYPSVCFDTFGLMNLEAMAMKKPVVATCFGGSKEIVVDGETGCIVNPLNIKEMAEKIEYLLNNPEKAREMGERGYERALNKFNLNEEINKYLAIFKKLINT